VGWGFCAKLIPLQKKNRFHGILNCEGDIEQNPRPTMTNKKRVKNFAADAVIDKGKRGRTIGRREGLNPDR